MKAQNLSNNSSSKTDFLTFKAQIVFIQLWKAYIKVLIFHHFDPKRYIQIETDSFSYAIGAGFSQMTLDQ